MFQSDFDVNNVVPYLQELSKLNRKYKLKMTLDNLPEEFNMLGSQLPYILQDYPELSREFDIESIDFNFSKNFNERLKKCFSSFDDPVLTTIKSILVEDGLTKDQVSLVFHQLDFYIPKYKILDNKFLLALFNNSAFNKLTHESGDMDRYQILIFPLNEYTSINLKDAYKYDSYYIDAGTDINKAKELFDKVNLDNFIDLSAK